MATKKHKRKRKKQDGRSILIPPTALENLLRLPAPLNTNCIALYVFYLHKAVRDKSNRIWCSNRYVSGKIVDGERKGLKWSIDRVKEARVKLTELGYIKLEQEHDKQGHFGKTFIRVKFYASKMIIENAEYIARLDKYKQRIRKLKKKTAFLAKYTGGRVLPPAVKPATSLIVNKKKTYKKQTVAKNGDGVCSFDFGDKLIEIKSKNRFDYNRAIKLCKALQSKRKIFKKVDINKWIRQFEQLRVLDGVEKKQIKQTLKWYIRHIGEDYIPQAYSAKSFRDKFDQISAAKTRQEKKDGDYDGPDGEDYPRIVEDTTFVDNKRGTVHKVVTDYGPEEGGIGVEEEWTDAKGQKLGTQYSLDDEDEDYDDEDEE